METKKKPGWLAFYFYFYFHFIFFFVNVLILIFQITGILVLAIIDFPAVKQKVVEFLQAPNKVFFIPHLFIFLSIGQVIKHINIKKNDGRMLIIKWKWIYIVLTVTQLILVFIQIPEFIDPLYILIGIGWLGWHTLWLVYFYRSKKVENYFKED